MAKKPFPFSVCEECCVAGGGGGGGGEISIDTEMSDTSENAVQNKVIKKYVDEQVEGLQFEIERVESEAINQVNNVSARVSDNEMRIVFIEEQVGNIDSALDNIIEIQNSLIGGDA